MRADERMTAVALVEEHFEKQRTVLGVRGGAHDDVVGVAEDGEVDAEGTPMAIGDFGFNYRRRSGRFADIWVKEEEKEGKGYWRCGGSGGWRDRSCGIGTECRLRTPTSLRTSPSTRRETWNPARWGRRKPTCCGPLKEA